MSSTLFLNIPQVSVGLPTFTYTVPAVSAAYPFGGAGVYNVQVSLTVTNSVVGTGAGSGIPLTAQTVSGSGAQYVVNQNGSPVYTSPAITPFQTALQSKTELLCAVTDIITVVFSSSTAIDEQLNTLQSTVSINQGI